MFVSGDAHVTYGVYNISGIEEACPIGFPIPENPSDKDNEWINGTSCAVACRSPINSPELYTMQATLVNSVSWIGMFCILFLASTLMLDHKFEKRVNYIVFAACFMSGITTFWTWATSFLPPEQIFCRDNTNAITAEDGATLCSVQSFINIYAAVGLVIVWVLQMGDIFLNVVYGKPDRIISQKSLCCALIYVTPFIPALSILLSGKAGHTKGNPTCWTSSDAGNVDMWIFVFIFVAAIVSALMFGAVLRNVLIILSVNIYYSQSSKEVSSDDNVGFTPSDLEAHVDIGGHLMRDEVEGHSIEFSARSQDYREKEIRGDNNSVNSLSTKKSSGGLHKRSDSEKSKDGALVPVMMDLFKLLLQRNNRVEPQNSNQTEIESNYAEGATREGSLDEIIARNKLLSYSLNLTQRVKALQSPLLFVGGFLICAFGLWVGRLVLLLNEDSINDNFESWTHCIFSNYFDGYTNALMAGELDNGYYDLAARDDYAHMMCNDSSTERVSYVGVGVWFYIGAFGNSFFVFCAYIRARDVHKMLYMILTCGGT